MPGEPAAGPPGLRVPPGRLAGGPPGWRAAWLAGRLADGLPVLPVP